MDESDEWEEETSYIVMDLGPDVTADEVKKIATSHNGVSLIVNTGLDKGAPYLRIGNMVFQGKADVVLATDLIFAASTRSKKKSDDIIDARPGASSNITNKETASATDMEYLDSSDARLRFRNVRFVPKDIQQTELSS